MLGFSLIMWVCRFILLAKNLYGNFGISLDGHHEYFLKLDGYYYCKKQNKNIAVIRVRNKRTADKLSIQEIINDKDYLKELHPADACILGIIANNERNGVINKEHLGWNKMSRSKEYDCFVKSPVILEVVKKYHDSIGNEMVILYSKVLNKEIKINAIDLCKNQALLYALGSFQALSMGFDASELIVRNCV